MSFKNIILKDLEEYNINQSFIKSYIKIPGFKFTTNLRLCNHFKNSKLIFLIFRFNLRRLSIKYGIQIPWDTEIGEGFTIHHHNGIVIHKKAKLGRNINIRHNVTIGNVRGNVPTVGNDVYIGNGASIVGNVKVGNNVTIGANSVVVNDVPDNVVVAGNPAKIIKTIKE